MANPFERRVQKSAFETLQEDPRVQEELEKMKDERIEEFLKAVRESPSVEEAVYFAPDTDVMPLILLGENAEIEAAEKIAETMREMWRPLIEQIRSAKDESEARQLIGKFEALFAQNGGLDLLEAARRAKEERD